MESTVTDARIFQSIKEKRPWVGRAEGNGDCFELQKLRYLSPTLFILSHIPPQKNYNCVACHLFAGFLLTRGGSPSIVRVLPAIVHSSGSTVK